MNRYPAIKSIFRGLFLAYIATVGLNACTNHSEGSIDEYMDEYDSQVSALRQASSEHADEIMEANSIEDIEKIETRYRQMTRDMIDNMSHIVGDMEECHDNNGKGPNTGMLHDDIESMRTLYESHFEEMSSSDDADAATDIEDTYGRQMGDEFEQMAKHQDRMMSGAMGMMCGGMHDNGSMMNGGHMNSGRM